jgi:putative heme-binding domain-containing protein
VYGGGAPTGMCFYENGALGEKWNGLLLSCETGRNVVFGYLPKPDGAGFKLERFDFCTTNTTGVFKGSDFVGGAKKLSDERHTLFRPSDVCVGADGAIYVSDWFDKRTGGHQDTDETCSGTIYRIAPKGFKPKNPELKLDTLEGQFAALQSPATNVRQVAFARLKAAGDVNMPAVLKLREHANPYIAARAVWLLAQLGEPGLIATRTWLESEDATKRLVALRAIRAASNDAIDILSNLTTDLSPMVRSEVAVALRDVPAAQSVPLLVKLSHHIDGGDRSLLEAWGIGCAGKEEAVWTALKPEGAWNDDFAHITWRLHPAAAVSDLAKRAANGKLLTEQRKLALDTLAFIPEASAAAAVLELAKDKESPIHADILWWLIKRSTDDWSTFGIAEALKKEGIFDPESAKLVTIVTPAAIPSTVKLEEVLKLQGNAKNGAQLVTRCVMCHQVNGQGVEFGPNLEGWGRSQPGDIIAQALIEPSKDIAHGYDGQEIVTKDGVTIHGMILTEGNIMIIRSMGGQNQYVSKSRILSRRKLNQSMMLSASQLGLTVQDVADIVAYLRSGK